MNIVKNVGVEQKQTPLFDALDLYNKKQNYSFHVPGHKDGLTFVEKANHFYKEVLKIDATEVEGLDDLYQPDSAIKKAQELLAQYYGTRKSYFLVNGTTVGNLVMVLGTCMAGDVVLVQRNSHKSIFNALKLAGVRPVFLDPEVDENTGLPVGLSMDTFKQALQDHPEAKLLVLTYPDYYGTAPNYKQLITKAKVESLIVLVDEAHGAHFKATEDMPPSSLDWGADMVVHSAHKTLPAMTMGSYLHVNSTMIDHAFIEEQLQTLQTSSPSYPIMASLDLARYYVANLTQTDMARILKQHQEFVDALKKLPNIDVLTKIGEAVLDPLKILIRVSKGNGFDLQTLLYQSGLYPELADPYHVLMTLPLDTFETASCIKKIETACDKITEYKQMPQPKVSKQPKVATMKIPYDRQRYLKKVDVPVNQAVGYVAAQNVIPYPPGVPVVLDGEAITEDSVERLNQWLNTASHIQSGDLLKKGFIRVYGEIYNT